MQGVYCNIHDLPAEEDWSERVLPPINHQVLVHSSRKKGGCGSEERTTLGLQGETGCYEAEGGVPGTPGVTVEPSGDVVGSSTKHQRRRVPT